MGGTPIKRSLDYSKIRIERSKEHVLRVINVTYAKLQGETLTMIERKLAKPVQRVRGGFLVRAQYWEFKILRDKQHFTNAKRATVTFVEAEPSSVQSLQGWSTYIKVEMPECSAAYWELITWARGIGEKLNDRGWKNHGEHIKMFVNNDEDCQVEVRVKRDGHAAEPEERIIKANASLSIVDWGKPFFILEAAVLRTREDLLRKANWYKNGTKSLLKILAMLELRADPQNQYHVFLTIWRLKKIATPKRENRHSFRMSWDILHDLVEVFPQKARGLLRINLQDLVGVGGPGHHKYEEIDSFINIPLITLHDIGKKAVEAKIEEDRKGKEAGGKGCAPSSSAI